MNQGLVEFANEDELDKKARAAYRAYGHDKYPVWNLQYPFRLAWFWLDKRFYKRDDPVIKNVMLDLTLVCEDVANNIEDRLTGGWAVLAVHATLACAAVRWPGWDADVTQMKRPPTEVRDLGPVVNLESDCVFLTGADGALVPYDSLVDPIVIMRRIGLGFLTTD